MRVPPLLDRNKWISSERILPLIPVHCFRVFWVGQEQHMVVAVRVQQLGIAPDHPHVVWVLPREEFPGVVDGPRESVRLEEDVKVAQEWPALLECGDGLKGFEPLLGGAEEGEAASAQGTDRMSRDEAHLVVHVCRDGLESLDNGF